MQNLPAWAIKIQSAWFAIGTLLVILGSQQGVNLPSWLTAVVSEEFINNAMVLLGSILAFIQYARNKVTGQVAEVEVLTAGQKRIKVIAYAINPFKGQI